MNLYVTTFSFILFYTKMLLNKSPFVCYKKDFKTAQFKFTTTVLQQFTRHTIQ